MKMTVLASHQPDFFPYLGYFYKMFQSDVFIFSDNVLYSKTGRHNYNEILTSAGPKRFTLPIHYHVRNLNEIQIAADDRTVQKMAKTLWMEYRRAEHFHTVFPVIEELLMEAPEAGNLAQFNRHCILEIARRFGIPAVRRELCSSNLNLKNQRDERIIEMCRMFWATVYYSGTGAKDYHIEEEYTRNGIRLVYSDYEPVKYPQVGGRSVENLSVIDYVMNCGFELPRGWKKWESPKT